MFGLMEKPYIVPEKIETRWASPENYAGDRGAGGPERGGRKGSPCFPLKAGEQKVLAEAKGTSGTVRRIWATINDRRPQMLRGLRLDFYWDGASRPAVSAPFGDFFGTGLGRMAKYESALFASPEGRSFNCFIPMPFRSGMKIVATNESGIDLPMFFYDVNYTLGDPHGDDALYFHAHYRRENPTQLQQDYHILPKVEGKGRYLGVNIGCRADMERYFNTWWGEGEVKVFMDGDTELPTLCGTGTEDYIGTGWGQGRYAHLYQGCHVADEKNFNYCFYRYHVPDPVYFRNEARITIQQIGCWGPNNKPLLHYRGEPVLENAPGMKELDLSKDGDTADFCLFERQDDWSSCAYFYLDRPENDLPDLDPVEKRTADLPKIENPDERLDA